MGEIPRDENEEPKDLDENTEGFSLDEEPKKPSLGDTQEFTLLDEHGSSQEFLNEANRTLRPLLDKLEKLKRNKDILRDELTEGKRDALEIKEEMNVIRGEIEKIKTEIERIKDEKGEEFKAFIKEKREQEKPEGGN